MQGCWSVRSPTTGRCYPPTRTSGRFWRSTRAIGPSVLYIRRVQGRRVEQLVDLVIGNLDIIENALGEGSIVVLGEGSVRIRRLPIL